MRRDSDADLSDDEIRVLKEFAGNVIAGRRLMRMVAWLGGIAASIAALAYYILGAINGWHGMKQP